MKHSEETKKKISLTKRGKPSWNKGLKGFRAGEKRPNIVPKGSDSVCWKGKKVSYRGLHMWVELLLGKPKYCVKCGKESNGHNMHWANISGEYKREITDWIRLCAKCHGAYDKEKGLRKRKIIKKI